MQILGELRGPRVAAAFACGGLLALAGALMQTLFRNPLAEPYLLGVSGGAGLLALLGMAAGLAWPWVSALAFAGIAAAQQKTGALSTGDAAKLIAQTIQLMEAAQPGSPALAGARPVVDGNLSEWAGLSPTLLNAYTYWAVLAVAVVALAVAVAPGSAATGGPQPVEHTLPVANRAAHRVHPVKVK